MINFYCAACGKDVHAQVGMEGRHGKCPHCGFVCIIPDLWAILSVDPSQVPVAPPIVVPNDQDPEFKKAQQAEFARARRERKAKRDAKAAAAPEQILRGVLGMARGAGEIWAGHKLAEDLRSQDQ
jgi:DNA-directed RNA polymerase subunit RPC12/RpoP